MFNPLRLFAAPAEAVLSLEVQARMPSTDPEKPSQFRILVRYFLDRFFNNEMASSDGEGKTRLILIACAVGLPGFMMALYLYPSYHDIRAHKPYWGQVGDHYFYVVYSLVALGIVTIFEWDFFFPDLLDVFVLTTLPVRNLRLFLARIAAVAVFLGAFLFDSNVLAPLVLPAATDPPNLIRFLFAHVVAVTASGIFAATIVLTLQSVLLGVFGERLFRRISLPLQGLFITTLLTILFLSSVLSRAVPAWMHAGSPFMLYFPPFWFLGLYQRILEGPSISPMFADLARIGCFATLTATAAAVACYPLAYWRRTRGLVEGSAARTTRNWIFKPVDMNLHATLLRKPLGRAIFHFISQTLLRIPRYRIYLVMYGGLGMALACASALRIYVGHGATRIGLSADGLRAVLPIVAFWTVSGLRNAFLSPADQRGRWIFRITKGKPGLEQLGAARLWVLLWGTILTLGAAALIHIIAPAELRGWRSDACQAFVAIALCLLLSDAFFLNVRTLPFTGGRTAPVTNLAFVLIRYVAFVPPLVVLTVAAEPWIEASPGHFAIACVAVVAGHLWMEIAHRRFVAEHLQLVDADEDEEPFPLRLGLRY
jgi:hypothetical protein